MELKRILARDTRTATEQAIALYGPDVLVISNHQIDGQTELVVALDVQPEPAPAAVVAPAAPAFQRSFMRAQQVTAAQVEPLVATELEPVPEKESEKALDAAVEVPAVRLSSITPNFSSAPHPAAAIPAAPAVPVALLSPQPAAPAQEESAATLKAAEVEAAAAAEQSADTVSTSASPHAAELQAQAQARDLQRSHELVDLVRGEIAALRREFRLSQQSSAWQSGLQLHPSLSVLVQALSEAQVPMALRALLMDALQDQNDPHQALAVWRSQLEHSLARPQQAMLSQGLHVLAGPSGSGKTMMCARLAQHASAQHGCERLALISYRDHRAGAWSQIQMLGSQLGIDCFRANDEDALRLLVGELGPRSLVLIDTCGTHMAERVMEIQAVCPTCSTHALVAADASSATLRRALRSAGIRWNSLMVSKLDESVQPWPLVEFLCDNFLPLSAASDGAQLGALRRDLSAASLVEMALAQLSRAPETIGPITAIAPILVSKPLAVKLPPPSPRLFSPASPRGMRGPFN
jgi:flagellar biosynthesis protein FlhF